MGTREDTQATVIDEDRSASRGGRPRIGLVLGGGGPVGHGYEAGVLRALHDAMDWDARDAEVIVGTSAGSQVGALLRAGLSPDDLAARAGGTPMSPEGEAIASSFRRPHERPSPSLGALLRPASPAYLGRVARRPWRAHPARVFAAVAPAGQVSLEPMASGLREIFGRRWPDDALWIPGLDVDSGRRVVFGREGDPFTDVGTAVAASCAVPGWFSPVEVGTRRYVDGGVYSLMNLDLVADLDLDLVIAVSPMTAVRRSPASRAQAAVRTGLRFLLHREASAVRGRGTEVVAFQPHAADLSVMGLNAMDLTRVHPVVAQAYDSTLARLRRPDAQARLTALSG